MFKWHPGINTKYIEHRLGNDERNNPLMIPFYLQHKLSGLGIDTLEELQKQNYFTVFQWLKDIYPSIGYKLLFDLHCLNKQIPLNSLSHETQQQIRGTYKTLIPHYAPLPASSIEKYMQLALQVANTEIDEIPVGAVIVKDGTVIAAGANQTIKTTDITRHAEIVAIIAAAKKVGSHRLDDCDLYVTIEPCLMCVGAILHSRIRRVIFGAAEPKTGAIISQYQALNNYQVNKHTEAIGPIDSKEYAKALRSFLKSRRQSQSG